MSTRRALLASLAGGWAALAGCTSTGERDAGGSATATTTGETTPRTAQPSTTAPEEPTTAQPTETPPPGASTPDAPIDLGLSLRYAGTTPAETQRIEAHRTPADCFDAVRIDGRHYTATAVRVRYEPICHTTPTYRHVVRASETSLQSVDMPDGMSLVDATALHPNARSLVDRVLAAKDNRRVVAERDGLDADFTTASESTTPTDRLFDGQAGRYVRVDGGVYLFEHTWETSPACADGGVTRTLKLERTDTDPEPDAAVLRTVPLSVSAARTVETALSAWVVTRSGPPPETIRTLAENGPVSVPGGTVAISVTPTDGGYRLAAVRLFDQAVTCPRGGPGQP